MWLHIESLSVKEVNILSVQRQEITSAVCIVLAENQTYLKPVRPLVIHIKTETIGEAWMKAFCL